MHIPDGYLSPSTCATLGAAMMPAWALAARRVQKVVKSRYVPLVALGAAYSFLVMMFNIPVPDGTTAHAVGAVLVAVLLGPWAAVVAVSIALAIQALIFGDGGVLANGANAFNMALLMPFGGYLVYRLVARHATLTSRRRAFAAGAGAYVGLNLAALATAIELGIQPDLFHAADGTPLYSPFHLHHTIGAMALAHLTVAGFVEAALTAGVVAYLQRANLPVLRINHRGVPDGDGTGATTSQGDRVTPVLQPTWRWALYGLGAMVVLTPLGLLAPGGAFGEDHPDDLDLARYHLDAVPVGLRRYAGVWHHAIFDGYGFSGDRHPVLGYLVSAIVGLAVAGLAVYATFVIARRMRSA